MPEREKARGPRERPPESRDRERPPEGGWRGRIPVLAVLVVIVALAAGGCGRKAKPEPLWSATRLSAIIDQAR